MPTRRIHDVIHGLEQLFGDLIDFDDALNQEAAKQYHSNKVFYMLINTKFEIGCPSSNILLRSALHSGALIACAPLRSGNYLVIQKNI